MSVYNQNGSDAPKEAAQNMDAVVGRNIQKYRQKKRWTQHDLAARLGLSYQQVQKFENATNRISAGRLYVVADALGVSVLDLFTESQVKKPPMKDLRQLSPAAVKLAQAYEKLAKPKAKKAVATILRELSDA